MNNSGWLRGMMAKKMSAEAFCECVMESVYKEIRAWGWNVILLYDWQEASEHVPVTLILDGKMVRIDLTKTEVESQQKKSPYSVDKMIWTAIHEQGIKLNNSVYMRYVWMQP
ncbi:hypothetical protein K8O68_03720 [Salipaludibacillus sp. CUR1]|uniref:hypothetical protein n=1 Tax=Salipaludibacillus sp. CUR1 TaxID=2820003 RepID=UPI001E5D16B7|nr:hypothetical protein [Salipaludibacillus sp. CUR1]MCE7791533.1 hypothetical protein [Salipaludibacillus sp. CUR1]